MSAKIVVTYKNKTFKGDFLEINFDTLNEDKLSLEMGLIGISSGEHPIWEIYSDGIQLDTGDLTKGLKAELWILKTYAGTKENPHLFQVKVRDHNRNNLAILQISVYAIPKITDAFWGKYDDEKIFKASVNDVFTAYFQGHGIYNIPLKLKFFLKSLKDDIEDIEIKGLAKTKYVNYPYDLAEYCIDRDILKNNAKFFLLSAPAIMMDYLSNDMKLAITGDIKTALIAKAYFTISYKENILFDGKKRALLSLQIDMKAFGKPQPQDGLSPSVVYNEEYFTQKYEPCKYEKIYYDYKTQKKIEVFDEKKPTKKNSYGSFKNDKIEISIIAPPKKSINIKDLVIKLEEVETTNCSLLDENKEQTNFGDRDDFLLKKPHKGRVFDVKNLNSANIESHINEPDKIITIKPSFNYLYDNSEPWKFLKNYFLFSSLLRNTSSIENEIKGKLMDAEAHYKGIIDTHKIRIETCRYKKSLSIKTYADVAWGFHALFDDPYIPEYYIFGNKKTIKTIRGLEAEIDWIKDNKWIEKFTAPILGCGLDNNFIRDFCLDIVEDIADRYEMGFTAYYDFDEKGENNCQQIDYANTHPEVFKTMIGGIVTLEILIDVLLIILTEGAALANFVSKAGKVAGIVNKSNKITKAGMKAEDILAKRGEIFEKARLTKNVKSKFELIKGSYFRGYRYINDDEIGIQPVLEERVKISPLINIGIVQKKSLGELLVDKSPVGMILNFSKSATSGFLNGPSRTFTDRITYTNRAGQKVKIGKKIGAWARAVKYPLKIINAGVTKIYDLAAFATDEALKNVFGTEAEFEKDITAHMDLDFWLKIHNEEKKLELLSLLKGQSKTDKSSISIATAGAFTVKLKLSANVSNKVLVRCMHILTWNNKETTMQEMKGDGTFEIEGNVFIEKRFYFDDVGSPYHEDKIVFTGLAGEYEYKKKVKIQKNGGIEDEIIEEQKTKQFMLMEPCELLFHSTKMTKNPSDDK